MTSENNFGGVASPKCSVKYIGLFYERDLRGESNKRIPSERDENVCISNKGAILNRIRKTFLRGIFFHIYQLHNYSGTKNFCASTR